MSLTPDEMRERFTLLSAEDQVKFLEKIERLGELMGTVTSTIQNAVVSLYPAFELMGESWKEVQAMLEPLGEDDTIQLQERPNGAEAS